jgi:hypothetical protein
MRWFWEWKVLFILKYRLRKGGKKMPIALKRIIKAVKSIEVKKKDERIAEKWLGAFEGAVPERMTSTEYIKKLRESCYGKF